MSNEQDRTSQYILAKRGGMRSLITFDVPTGQVISEEPLEKDRVTKSWGHMVEGKFVPVEGLSITYADARKHDIRESWQIRKDIE